MGKVGRRIGLTDDDRCPIQKHRTGLLIGLALPAGSGWATVVSADAVGRDIRVTFLDSALVEWWPSQSQSRTTTTSIVAIFDFLIAFCLPSAITHECCVVYESVWVCFLHGCF